MGGLTVRAGWRLYEKQVPRTEPVPPADGRGQGGRLGSVLLSPRQGVRDLSSGEDVATDRVPGGPALEVTVTLPHVGHTLTPSLMGGRKGEGALSRHACARRGWRLEACTLRSAGCRRTRREVPAGAPGSSSPTGACRSPRSPALPGGPVVAVLSDSVPAGISLGFNLILLDS